MKIVFMGTPEFAAPSLRALSKSKHEVCLVISQPDRAGNRGKMTMPIIKEIALAENLPVMQPERIKQNEKLMDTLREINPDMIIVAAYGKILPKELLDLPRFGCINVHASLLPKFRGASPIQHAILTGETHAGVTIMKMAEGLDTGDMYSQASLEIAGSNYPELSERLAELGADLLLKTMDEIESGKARAEVQDESKVTHTGIIKKDEGRVSFIDESAAEIERKLRAFTPWPGIYFELGELKIKIKAAEVLDDEELVKGKSPAEVIAANNDGIDVICREGILRIKELQAPGKKSMKSGDYLRGNKLEIGTILGR